MSIVGSIKSRFFALKADFGSFDRDESVHISGSLSPPFRIITMLWREKAQVARCSRSLET